MPTDYNKRKANYAKLLQDPRYGFTRDVSPGVQGVLQGLEGLAELPGIISEGVGYAGRAAGRALRGQDAFSEEFKKPYDLDFVPQGLEDYVDESQGIAAEYLGEEQAARQFGGSKIAGEFISPVPSVAGVKAGAAAVRLAPTTFADIAPRAVTEITGLSRAIREGDSEFITGWRDSARFIQGYEAPPAGSVGAASRKGRTIVADIDGEPHVMDDVRDLIPNLAKATGKTEKTIRNKLNLGELIEDPNTGIVYRQPKEGDNFGPAWDIVDKRETTLGTIEGYDGTFSDLMREYGIDPRSDEATTIRQRMDRGHTWEGYRRSDKEEFGLKQQREYAKRAPRAAAAARERSRIRVERLGLDTDNKELVETFHKIWQDPDQKIGNPTRGEDELIKFKIKDRWSRMRSPEIDRMHQERSDLLKQMETVNDPDVRAELGRRSDVLFRESTRLMYQKARGEAYGEWLRHRRLGSKGLTKWKRFFKKHMPERYVNAQNAEQERGITYEILQSVMRLNNPKAPSVVEAPSVVKAPSVKDVRLNSLQTELDKANKGNNFSWPHQLKSVKSASNNIKSGKVSPKDADTIFAAYQMHPHRDAGYIDLFKKMYSGDLTSIRKESMGADLYRFYEELPDTVTIYRGVAKDSFGDEGWSWTFDEGLAKYFASNNRVVKATVNKKDILTIKSEYHDGGSEVIVDPSRVKIK